MLYGLFKAFGLIIFAFGFTLLCDVAFSVAFLGKLAVVLSISFTLGGILMAVATQLIKQLYD